MDGEEFAILGKASLPTNDWLDRYAASRDR